MGFPFKNQNSAVCIYHLLGTFWVLSPVSSKITGPFTLSLMFSNENQVQCNANAIFTRTETVIFSSLSHNCDSSHQNPSGFSSNHSKK